MRSPIAYLVTLPEFLSWFFIAAVIFCVFMLAYTMLTPWREIRLIRAGKATAALSFAGTLIGYTLVLYSIMRHAVSRTDRLSWGLVCFAVQLLALGVAWLVIGPTLRERIGREDMAAGIVVAGLSLAFSRLNAVTMTPDGAP